MVIPPVVMMTPFLARIFTLGLVRSMLPSERKLFSGVDCPEVILGVYSAVMPITRPASWPRVRFAHKTGHFCERSYLFSLNLHGLNLLGGKQLNRSFIYAIEQC